LVSPLWVCVLSTALGLHDRPADMTTAEAEIHPKEALLKVVSVINDIST